MSTRLSGFAFALLSTASICNAEPGKDVLDLLEEPVSLFEKGMQDMTNFVDSIVELKGAQENYLGEYDYVWKHTTILYNPRIDRLKLNFFIESDQRENFKPICVGAMTYLRGFLLSMEPGIETSLLVGGWFLPYRFQYFDRKKDLERYTPEEVQRARYIDSIAVLTVIVERSDNPHSFFSCSFRINDDEVIFDEMKADSHEH